MNKENFQKNWNELKGRLREKFSKLTPEEIEQIQGNLDKFLLKIQTKYGYARQKAEEEINQFLATCKTTQGANREQNLHGSRPQENKKPGQNMPGQASRDQNRSKEERKEHASQSSQKQSKSNSQNW